MNEIADSKPPKRGFNTLYIVCEDTNNGVVREKGRGNLYSPATNIAIQACGNAKMSIKRKAKILVESIFY